jgi:hypothetical protein
MITTMSDSEKYLQTAILTRIRDRQYELSQFRHGSKVL